MRNPWIADAFDLYRHTEGRLGLAVLDMPAAVSDAMSAIDIGVTIKREAEHAESMARARVKA